MKIGEFTRVRESENLTFDDIWRIYDTQFETLRDFILTLGDKYEVQEFTGSSSKVLTLDNSYSSGQVFVYINGVIQWKSVDYEETSPTKITLINARKTSDIVRVVTIRSNIFQVGVETYVDQIKRMCEESSGNLDKAHQLLNALNLLSTELEAKRDEFEKQKHILEDFLIDFDEKVAKSEENMDSVRDMKSSIDSSLLESEAYLKKMKELKDTIEALAILSPEEIVNNEVVLARGGATSLGLRLDNMVYKFPSIKDMQQCLYLKDGDECIVVDDSDITNLVDAKVFRICSKAEDIPGYVSEYHRISVPDYKYAYVINHIASKSYVDRQLDEEFFELSTSMLCQSYGLSTVILELLEDTSGFDLKDEVTSKALDAYWNGPMHSVSYSDTEEIVLKSITFTLDSPPEYLVAVEDYEGTGVVEVSISLNGGSKKFTVRDRELIDLSTALYDDGTEVRPTVKMIVYIKMGGDVTLKNIAYGVR